MAKELSPFLQSHFISAAASLGQDWLTKTRSEKVEKAEKLKSEK